VAAADHPFALSEDQMRVFEDQGFLVLRGQLPDEVLSALDQAFTVAIDRFAQVWHAAGLVDDLAPDLPFDPRLRTLHAQFDESVPSAWRKILVTREVYGLWRRPEILGPVRSLVGDEVYAHGIWNGRPRLPDEHTAQVLWHQDAHYYRGWDATDGRLVSVWMPLVPVDRQSSCLEFAAGSHRLGRVDRHRAPNGLFTVSDQVLEGRPVVPAEMAPGDIVLFTDTTLHQSTRNVSGRIRWSLDIRFAEATPQLLAKDARGYRCHSATDPGQVESFEVWAERYDYEPEVLVDELENFAGLDPQRMRRSLARVPARLDVY
jgi:phytanoyl-CoA hydroxylase